MDILQYKLIGNYNIWGLPKELSNNITYRSHYYLHMYGLLVKNAKYIMYTSNIKNISKYKYIIYCIHRIIGHNPKYQIFGTDNENLMYNYVYWYNARCVHKRIEYNNKIYTMKYYNNRFMIYFDLYGNIIGYKINKFGNMSHLKIDDLKNIEPTFLKAVLA